MKIFHSKNVVLDETIISGGILVGEGGKIEKILNESQLHSEEYGNVQKYNFGTYHIMAGVIDSHVHVNEPGRTAWEGYESATKAAASGGITTIADMPLNSIPPTTSVENFKVKLEAAKDKIYVDVAFWGGVVPGNQNELRNMVKEGIVAFKCFMCPSGVEEFQHVKLEDAEASLIALQGTGVVLAFHAEEDCRVDFSGGDETLYETFLKSRPAEMELGAIRKIIALAEKYRARTHIVHLSTAEGLPLIKEAKSKGINITTETCHHYLNIASEEIQKGQTQYKCCPPIRNCNNKESLWDGLKDDVLDMVVSDHSPSTADLKFLNGNEENFGNFFKAWGGIASLQFGLSLFWSEASARGFSIFAINKYMSRATSKLIGLDKRKGQIKPGYDADLVVWDPSEIITVRENIIHHKNKTTPYLGKKLFGKITKTILRGEIIYVDDEGFFPPKGLLLVN